MMGGDSCYRLSNEQRAGFDRDGFVGPLPAFLDSDALDSIRSRFHKLVSEREVHPIYGRFSVRDWHLVFPPALQLYQHPAIVTPLRQLSGDDLILWRSKIFYKEPGAGEIGWHQEWGWFNGEEIGNDRPGLMPARTAGEWWNLTIWIALDDVSPENGALQFVRASQRTRYPIAMVPIVESAFFQDPFVGHPTTDEIIARARDNKLVLDVETSAMFDGMDPHRMRRDDVIAHAMKWLRSAKAAVTLPFEAAPDRIVTLRMKKGEFVIFTERTMHGSLPNTTARSRVAISARVTNSDTLVYPGRLRGEFIDGSNLDIRGHRCVLLSGRKLHPANVYSDPGEAPLETLRPCT